MTSRRPPDLVAFDVDGTLVDDTVFVWETLHQFFGTDPDERAAVARSYLDGEIDYAAWFEHDIRVLREKGARRASMFEAIREMRPMAGAHETLATLAEAGVVLAVISGSLSFVLDHIFPEHPFVDVLINQIEFDEAGEISRWRPTPFDMASKEHGLRMLAEKHGVPLSRCAFVGDHWNDVAVAKAAGLGVAFNCKSDELAAVADVLVDSNDLRDVLPYLLGGAAEGRPNRG